MQAYQFERSVPPSHTITVELPADAPTGLAQVIVLFPDSPSTPRAPIPPHFASVAQYLAWHDAQPQGGRSAADVDTQLRQERDGWSD